MILYHLSESKWALENIEKERIKIAKIDDLNDPFELFGLDLKGKKQRRQFKEWRNKVAKQYGLVCFSRNWENPVLWSHYAENHKGIALGFEVSSKNLMDVIYTGTRLPPESVNEALGDENEEFRRKLFSMKYTDWAYEDEVRILTNLRDSHKESDKYFLPFSPELTLREIIAGPLCSITESKFNEATEHYSKKVELIKARLAFRSFRVVKNRKGFNT
jgi:hypothetical protein